MELPPESLDDGAAVDAEGLAVDAARGLAAQEEDERGDLLRRVEALLRAHVGQAAARLFLGQAGLLHDPRHARLQHRRVDAAAAGWAEGHPGGGDLDGGEVRQAGYVVPAAGAGAAVWIA